MRIREKTVYDSKLGKTIHTFKEITPAQFKERYGMTFNEWKAGLCKNDYRYKLKFRECYVDDDPYAADVCGETVPIIENSPDALIQSCIDSAYEI